MSAPCGARSDGRDRAKPTPEIGDDGLDRRSSGAAVDEKSSHHAPDITYRHGIDTRALEVSDSTGREGDAEEFRPSDRRYPPSSIAPRSPARAAADRPDTWATIGRALATRELRFVFAWHAHTAPSEVSSGRPFARALRERPGGRWAVVRGIDDAFAPRRGGRDGRLPDEPKRPLAIGTRANPPPPPPRHPPPPPTPLSGSS